MPPLSSFIYVNCLSVLICINRLVNCRSGKIMHFKGSSFHRVIPGFMCQVRASFKRYVYLWFHSQPENFGNVKGGDFTKGNGRGV